jgi:hypothetical protein
MCAGLEGDNDRCPSSPLAGSVQCHCFGVPVTELRVPAFSHQLPIPEDYGPYQRVGLDPPPPSPSEVEGAGHPFPLVHRTLEAHSQAQAGE